MTKVLRRNRPIIGPSDTMPCPPGRNGLAQPDQVWPEAHDGVSTMNPTSSPKRFIA